MANQRMFLRFKPTGDEAGIGKRMVTTGWYGGEHAGQNIAALFEKANAYFEEHGYASLDDFELVFEHEPGWDIKERP